MSSSTSDVAPGFAPARLMFGTWHFGGAWGTVDSAWAAALVRYARERGVATFDSARAYGAAEQVLGWALGEADGAAMIATKGGVRPTPGGYIRDASPLALRAEVDASLRALGVDVIDLYQVHHPDPRTPIEETAGVLNELVAGGKIRRLGLSNHAVAAIERFRREAPLAFLQLPYHLFWREVEAELLPYAEAHGIGVLVYAPLAHGLLTGALHEHVVFADDDWRAHSDVFRGESFRRNLAVVRALECDARELGCTLAELAIAWALGHPAVDAAIFGPHERAHVDAALRAAELVLDPGLRAAIAEHAAAGVPCISTPRFAD